jgi:hypothetical protein
MSRKVLTWAVAGAVCLSVLFVAGCGPQADLALKFTVGDRLKYKVTEESIKDFKFEQPSLDKVRFEPRSTTTQVEFIQEIESVDPQGAATAKIIVQGVKYLATDKDEIKFDFDSSRKADKKKPFSKLLGESYKIRLLPDGSVKVIDANKIRSAVTSGTAARVAKGLMNDKSIQKRHEILSLPDADNQLLSKGDNWTRVEEAQQRLMVPKSFEKTYTLKKVKEQDGRRLAFVDMNATESPTSSKGVAKIAGGMGLFANLFDTEETYTGQMILDLDPGKVTKYNEKFVTKYIAAEQSAKQKPDKGPDLLTITLTYTTTMEMID